MLTFPADEEPEPDGGGADTDTDAVLVYNVVRTGTCLAPYVDRGLRDLKLTGTQFNALLVLREAGPDGLPLSEIGRRLVVTRANVTGLVDRLERLGLARRAVGGDPDDRRVTQVSLTEEGGALLEAAVPRRRAALADVLGGMSRADKEHLIALLTLLRKTLREAGDGSAARGK